LQNQVRDFNGLARKPLCYRYTIPQELLNDINGLDGWSAIACGGIGQITASLVRRSTRLIRGLASAAGKGFSAKIPGLEAG
jgi:hypothetical protein